MQQETIQRIRHGDLDAYEAVVRQYQGILLGYAAHRLPDINAAQDLCQLNHPLIVETFSAAPASP